MDKFKLVRDFSRELTSTLELKELANVINNFAIVHLGASHSSIIIDGEIKHSYNNETKRIYNEIEEQVFKYIIKVLKPLLISNPKKEYMLQKIEGIDEFNYCLFSLPLITKNKPLGSLNLYFGSTPNDELVEFLNLFSELSSSSIMNSLAYKKLETKSVTDKLTGLSNRGNFDMELASNVQKCAESESSFSVMMVDIDNFKEYNDKFGHQKGDEILEQIGSEICAFEDGKCRSFRYGGEELAIILPELKPEEAFEKAEQIRKKIEQGNNITISIGLTTCLNSSCSPQKMVSEADKALYKAKKAGKNRTYSSIIVDNGLEPIDVQVASELGKK